MSLVRHIAGIPTATEQRCVRCCEAIRKLGMVSFWPGATILLRGKLMVCDWGGPERPVDCAPYDPHAGTTEIVVTEEGTRLALSALERARNEEMDMTVPGHLR